MKLACIDALAPGITLREKFQSLERLGFDGIEIWAGSAGTELEQEIKEIAAGSSVKPCSVIVADESFYQPLSSEEAKQAKFEAIKQSIGLAAATGAVSILVPEYGPQLPPPIFPLFPMDEARRGLLLGLVREAATCAEEAGVTEGPAETAVWVQGEAGAPAVWVEPHTARATSRSSPRAETT